MRNLNVITRNLGTKIFFLSGIIFSQISLANCYIVENFKGTSYPAVTGYSMEEDGMSDREFHININDSNATVTPDSGNTCLAMTDKIVVCTGGVNGQITNLEIYSVDERQRKAIYVQIRNGLEAILMSDLNGGKVLVGDITGNCDNE